MVPIKAEEEYNVIATLEPSNPHGTGAFGRDIALSKDFLLIGEERGNVEGEGSIGKAYLYDADLNLLSTLQAPEPEPNAKFGCSVDLLGDMMIIGSYLYDSENLIDSGEAYVFDSDGSLQFTLRSPDPQEVGEFGREVAFVKDVILVAETGARPQGVLQAGAVHVYNTEGVYLRTITSPSIKPNALFGLEIVANEEFILVGEPGNHNSPPFSIGIVHVYDHDWNLVTTIQAPEPEIRTGFGYGLAIRDEIVVIGEIWAEVEGVERAGSAYIFNTDWNLLAKLQSTAPRVGGEFGKYIASEGDIIVTGENKADVISIKEGKAYVFDLEGNLLSTIVSPDPAVGAQFGYEVATDGEIVLVAEVEATVDGVSRAGKVHIFGLGEPVAEPVVEEPVVEEEAEEPKSGSGIPGFPYESVLLGVVSVILVLWFIQRRR
jgi:hypothetical protein